MTPRFKIFATLPVFAGMTAASISTVWCADAAPAAPAGASATQPAAGSNADDVAAVVNDRVITFAAWSKQCTQFQSNFDDINNEVLEKYPNDLSKAREEFDKRVHAISMDVLRSMVNRLLIIQEFENPSDPTQKRQVPEAYLERQFEDQMTTTFNDDRETFLKFLAGAGMSEQDYRKELKENDEYGYMTNQLDSSVMGLSPDRIKTYYGQHLEDYRVPDSITMRQIVLVPVADSPVADLAAKISADARQPNADFAALAKKYSSDPAARDGNVPVVAIVRDNKIPPEILNALFSLEPGQVSDPVVSRNPATNQPVTFIFKCETKTAAGILPLDKAQYDIEKKLAKADHDQTVEKWLQRLREKAYIYPAKLFTAD